MDTSKLKPANENPWYILMTLCGEYEGEDIDWKLRVENRKLWNSWSCQSLPEEKRNEYTSLAGIPLEETDWTAEKSSELEERFLFAWRTRNRRDLEAPRIPYPSEKYDLSKTVFSNQVVAQNLIFRDVSFAGAAFLKRVNFSIATFVEHSQFASSVFEGDANFAGARFALDAGFSHIKFKSEAIFSNAKFERLAHFGSVDFLGIANFSGIEFGRAAQFYGSTFGEEANFSSSNFRQVGTFVDASFRKEANFSIADFQWGASFQRCSFESYADFRGRGSVIDLDRPPAAFANETIFSGAHFHRHADFRYRRFGPYERRRTDLSFANAIFDSPVTFEEAEFQLLMPNLTNATLPESTKLTANSKNWPRLTPSLLERIDQSLGLQKRTGEARQDPEILRASAATLRHAMARQMLPDEEHFFFRREMWANTQIGSAVARTPYFLYEILSGFGSSIRRPAVALFGIWLLGAVTYYAHTAFGWWKATAYSFAVMFKFFGFQSTYFDGVAQEMSVNIQLFAAIQTVLAFILLFFLGLGLRTRFRLR